MTTDEMAILALVALGALSVDSEGRVWRHREITHGSSTGGRERACDPRRADTGRSKKGEYRRVQVTIGKERFTAPAHRIVWMVANQRVIPVGCDINHKDGVKDNNHPSNLEPTTRAENSIHSLHTLGNYQNRKATGAKLTPGQVVEIRRLCDAKIMPRVQIAELFGVTTRTVGNIALRTKWGWVPEQEPESHG